MNIDVNLLLGLIAIISGIAILVKPKLLNYIVAIFLLVYGVLKILPYVT